MAARSTFDDIVEIGPDCVLLSWPRYIEHA